VTRRAGDVNPPVSVRARVARTASGTHQGRYRPIDIDRSPWDVFCDSFGLGTDDSWGIEMSQFSCPHTVSPSQCEAPAEPHPCRNALRRSLLLCKIAANRSQRGPAFGGSAEASPPPGSSPAFSQDSRELQRHWPLPPTPPRHAVTSGYDRLGRTFRRAQRDCCQSKSLHSPRFRMQHLVA
jgi:hypothetical protein